MKLKPLASNMTELELGSYKILFSYETPVAYQNHLGMYSITSKKWSRTTTRHINKWVDGHGVSQIVSQAVIDSLVSYLNGKENMK